MRELLTKNKWPLVLGAAAIIVRLIYLIQISSKPGFSLLMVDEQWHWLWAKELIDSSFWGEGSYFRGPLYPYFLAVLQLITGGSIFWTKAIQLLLCGVTSFFIFKISDNLFGRKSAIVAGIIYAFYGTLVFYETMFLIPVLFLPLILWGMYRLIRFQESDSLKSWLVTGIVFGLAAITQPNILLVVPFLALWIFFKRKKRTKKTSMAAKPAIAIFAGLFVAIAPVTIRNLAATGEFILISSQGGINFYLGNNEYADGLMMIMPEVELDNSITWNMFVPLTNSIAERETGREMGDGEISRFWSDKAVTFITNQPAKFLSLVWKKTVYLVSGFENSDATDIYFQRTKSGLYSILVWDKFISFPFGLLLPLAILSIYILRKDFGKLLPIYLFILAYAPTVILFLVTARHRLPIIPFLIIVSAVGMVRLIENFRGYTAIKKIALPLILVVSGLVLNQKYFDLGQPNPYFVHFNEGLTAQRLGDYVNAEKEYLTAYAAFPYSPALLVNLAEVQLNLDKLDEADKNLSDAIVLKPDYALSYNALGILVKRKGNLDSAAVLFVEAISRYNSNAARPNEIGGFYLNLADTYKQLENIDSALGAYHQAIARSPQLPEAYYQTAFFYAQLRMFDKTDSLYKAASFVRLPNASDQYNIGMTYIERGMDTDAVSMMRRALNKDEKFYRAWYVIAAVYNKWGEPKDSVSFYLKKCLALEPNFEPALKIKQEIERK